MSKPAREISSATVYTSLNKRNQWLRNEKRNRKPHAG